MIKENYFNILRDILNLQLKERTHRAELLRKLGYDKHNTYFHHAIKICVDNNIITEHSAVGVIKKLEINYDKLSNFIRKKSTEFNKWGKFIENTVTGFRY